MRAIKLKKRVDSYMPCGAMALTLKLTLKLDVPKPKINISDRTVTNVHDRLNIYNDSSTHIVLLDAPSPWPP